MVRILVVEDECDLRSVVADVLADAGYAVTTAADGADALRTISAQRPDVVLLDLVMPGMDGWEFLDCVSRSHALQGVPIGILSASTGAEATLPGTASRLIAKPFDVDELLSAVDELAAPLRVYAG